NGICLSAQRQPGNRDHGRQHDGKERHQRTRIAARCSSHVAKLNEDHQRQGNCQSLPDKVQEAERQEAVGRLCEPIKGEHHLPLCCWYFSIVRRISSSSAGDGFVWSKRWATSWLVEPSKARPTRSPT